MPTSATPKKAGASRPRKVAAKKRAASPRRRATKKVATDVTSSDVTPKDVVEQVQSAHRRSSRQIEQIALLALALLFGLIGLAVHVLWFVSIVLMALQLRLTASEVDSRRDRSVIAEMTEEIATVVDEIKSASSEHGRTAGCPSPQDDADSKDDA